MTTNYAGFWIWVISLPPLFLAAKRLQEITRIDGELASVFCEIVADCGRSGAGWIIGVIVQLKTFPIMVLTLSSAMIAALIPAFMGTSLLGTLLLSSIDFSAAVILTKTIKVLDMLKEALPRRTRELCGETFA